MKIVSEHARKGAILAIAATLLWATYPLFYKPLVGIDAYSLLACRVIFSEVFLLALLLITNRMAALIATIKTVKIFDVLLIAALIAGWWGLFIYGMLDGRLLEVSFGYFLSPIMTMVASRIITKTRLSIYKFIASCIAVIGVFLMSLHVLSLNSLPWLAIIIGLLYSFYGIYKKKALGDALIMQFLEISVLFPLALVFLFIVKSESHIFSQSLKINLLLVTIGLISVLPLWWYSMAAQRLSIMVLGFIQFSPPLSTALMGVFLYHEPFSTLQASAFILIILSLAIFFWDNSRKIIIIYR